MAAAYVTIYINQADEEHRVRTYGGNRSDVRQMKQLYDNMTKEEFLRKHPYFESACEKKFKVITYLDFNR